MFGHNVAGFQPISEIISNPDVAFKVGICLGFLVGFVIAVMVTHVYRDYREDKLKS